MIWKCVDDFCGWEGEKPAGPEEVFCCPICGQDVSQVNLERREGEEYICESCKHFVLLRRDGDVVEDLPKQLRACLNGKEYWIHDSRDAVRCSRWEQKKEKNELIDQALQKCLTIVELLEKQYTTARDNRDYLTSDVIRVNIEHYEHAIEVLEKRKRD